MQPQSRRILIWSAGVAAFAGAMVGAAFLGIGMAKRDLHDASGDAGRTQYPVGVIVTVGQGSEPVYFASSVQPLRDYWFAYTTAKKRSESDEPAGSVRKLTGQIEVRTLRQDADVVEVDVLTGDANGQTGWIHLSQLPPQP